MTKIMGLDEATTLANGDYFPFHPDGVEIDQRVSWANIKNAIASAFIQTLFDDAGAAAARSTLGLGTMATATETDYFLVDGSRAVSRIGIGKVPTVGLDIIDASASVLTRSLADGSGAPDSAIQIGIGGTHAGQSGGGPSFLMFGNNGAGTKAFMGRISATWNNPSIGSEAASITINVRGDTGDTTANTIAATFSSTRRLGIGDIVTPTAFIDLPPSISGAASFRLRPGVAVSSPSDGDVWYLAADRLKFRRSSTTETIASGVVGSGASATAGASYTSTEQAMLQAVYSAARAFGMLV